MSAASSSAASSTATAADVSANASTATAAEVAAAKEKIKENALCKGQENERILQQAYGDFRAAVARGGSVTTAAAFGGGRKSAEQAARNAWCLSILTANTTLSPTYADLSVRNN